MLINIISCKMLVINKNNMILVFVRNILILSFYSSTANVPPTFLQPSSNVNQTSLKPQSNLYRTLFKPFFNLSPTSFQPPALTPYIFIDISLTYIQHIFSIYVIQPNVYIHIFENTTSK